MKDIIKGLHAAQAVALSKAAEDVLRANGWNERAALEMIRNEVGHGLSSADAASMMAHVEYLSVDDDDLEDIPAVVNPDGTPTAATLTAFKAHTIEGKPINDDTNPGAYGRVHDMDCPGCINTPFTASPRSETYWSS